MEKPRIKLYYRLDSGRPVWSCSGERLMTIGSDPFDAWWHWNAIATTKVTGRLVEEIAQEKWGRRWNTQELA